MDGIWGDFHIEQIYKSQEEKIKSIALKDVSVIREGRFILSHTSFSACAGQKICIIGNSGSGKSTLLKILAGIMEIQEGNLFINQKAVKKESGLTH